MALSQMMQHYMNVKEKYPDCILFYRLGDFYEMFFDDAKKVSALLDLTLTGRDCGLEERAPMCGVPYHAADEYISRLVSKGLKVAICEQLEDPAEAKGLVKRDVIKVVTAGTLTGDGQLDAKANNYVCCAYKNGDSAALSWSDITTGELSVTEFSGGASVKNCLTYMLKLGVKEVICNDDMLLSSRDETAVSRNLLPRFSNYPDVAFHYTSAERRIKEQLKLSTLSAFEVNGRKNAICAVGALLDYLKETQMHALKNIDGVNYISEEDYMQLDSPAIRNLELVKTLADGKRYGSLIWVLDKTCTAIGARYLNTALLSPLKSIDKINYRLDGVEELYNATVVRLGLIDLLKNVKDIERLSGKISNDNVMPRDCIALSRSLSAIPNIKFQLSGFSSAILRDICERLYDLSDVANLIDSAVYDAPPTEKTGKGAQIRYIKSGFNEQLDELRSIMDNGKGLILDMEKRERDNTGIRTLKVQYNRVFGYYIEVTKSFCDKVPLHYVRRQTLAGAERYTTEELKALEDKILNSEEQSAKLEIQLFNGVKAVLAENIGRLKKISQAIAALDMLVSFAEVSKTRKYVRPKIVESGKPMIVRDGRHPVVEAISKDKFIPNDLLIDEGENRTLIITGPNMAGKSTYMRQTAIISIMAQTGCFVPAREAQIPIVDRVFTRVGASDNLISDQSTFMVEMVEVASILRNATKDSLLILDEVGRGTSTYDGLSIAWAVIEQLTKKVGAKTMFATHYQELTELENSLDGVKNYKVAVKEINGGVVFLRKIMRGGANRSFGIEVASLAGVPTEVTDRAKEILKGIERGGRKPRADDEEIKDEPSEIERILRELNLNDVSPMQAFMILGDLVEKVKL